MKKFHPFYVLGSIGMIVTALIHVILALGVGRSSGATWIPLYLVWTAFMFVGLPLTFRQSQEATPDGM